MFIIGTLSLNAFYENISDLNLGQSLKGNVFGDKMANFNFEYPSILMMAPALRRRNFIHILLFPN